MFGRKDKQAPIQEPPMPQPQQPQTAFQSAAQANTPPSKQPPLFIKLEKYNDLVKNLEELRRYSKEIKETLDNLAEVERRLTRGITASYRTLDSLDTLITIVSSRLVSNQPADMKESGALTQAERHNIEKYFSTVKDEINRVKSELTSMK